MTDNELRDRFAGFAVAGLVQAGAQQLLHGGAEGSSSTKADSIAELAATAYLIAGALMLRRKEVEDAESAQRAAHRAGPPPAGSR